MTDLQTKYEQILSNVALMLYYQKRSELYHISSERAAYLRYKRIVEGLLKDAELNKLSKQKEIF